MLSTCYNSYIHRVPAVCQKLSKDFVWRVAIQRSQQPYVKGDVFWMRKQTNDFSY